jgi:sialate O-acetylesterase
VGFFFARALYSQMTNPVPIGLIQVAKNGTPIADWTTYGGSNNGRLYQEKIKPLQPFAIRGVIWYQGEDDGGRESTALRYYQMLPGLIANWRTDWQQGNFPFFYVQLALISGRPNWAIVRDAQVATLDQTQSTAMACIIDIPTEPASEIHPKDKEPVGERLALAARALLYGEESLEYSGPIRDASKSFIQRNKIVVRFNHRGDGLFTLNNSAPGPFLLAGTDGVYYSATAQIVERTIIDNAGNPVIEPVVEVSSSFVPNPKSVRYCWGSYPLCNLFNNDGLPASPFQLPVSPLQLLEVP